MSLHHGCRAIDVYYQTRQEITLAMDKTESIVVGTHHTERTTDGKCFLQPDGIKLLVDGTVGEIEDAHRYRAYLIMARTDKTTVGGLYAHGFALLETFGEVFVQRSGKHPWVETVERFFFSSF